jgi:hypothetical protein
MVARRHGEIGENSGPAYANYAMRLLRAIYNFAITDKSNEPIAASWANPPTSSRVKEPETPSRQATRCRRMGKGPGVS